jgi:hypothetical protein
MQRDKHILMFSWVKKPKAHHKGLVFSVLFSFLAPTFSWAGSSEKSLEQAIRNVSSVSGSLDAIQNLNRAMEIAAVNPMDEWRREEVRKAMTAVPTAVASVAASFSGNVMGNSSLPLVLSMMGGAVDQNAPLAFDKHLKDAPKDFNANSDTAALQANKGGTLVVKEEAPVEPQHLIVSSASHFPAVSADLVDLKVASVSTPVVGTQTSQSFKQEKTDSIPVQESTVISLSRDLASAEATFKSKSSSLIEGSVQFGRPADSSAAEVNDLEEAPKTKKAAAKRKISRPTRKPLSWLLAPTFYLAESLFEAGEAHAEVGQGPANPQGESGGGAGEVLFGIAAIMAAVAPMVAASQQAQAQVKQAQIESNAQIQQTQIQTQTQRDLAQLSAQTSAAQTEVAYKTAELNNSAQKQRLQMNLAAAQIQRNEERQSKQDEVAYQRQLEAQRIAIANRQADETIRLAQANLEAKRIEAAIGVSRTASTQTVYRSPLAAALAAQAPVQGAAQPAITNTRAQSASRLLASVDSPLESLVQQSVPSRGLRGKRPLFVAPATRNTRRALLTSAQGSYKNGLSAIASGSYSGEKKLFAANSNSDLSQFTLQSGAQPAAARSFAADRNSQIERLGQSTHSVDNR